MTRRSDSVIVVKAGAVTASAADLHRQQRVSRSVACRCAAGNSVIIHIIYMLTLYSKFGAFTLSNTYIDTYVCR